MSVTEAVGSGSQLPPHAHVRVLEREYVIELDVSDFTENELQVELARRRVTVRGEQLGAAEDEERPFRITERLEETFWLPEDAESGGLTAYYRHGTLELHAPRATPEVRQVPIERPPSPSVNMQAEAV